MLEDLKLLLRIDSMDTSKDGLLKLLLKKATVYVKNYCNIATVPLELEDTITDIAIIMYNRQGTEGLSSESYSGISNNFEDDISKPIKKALNRCRRVF